MFDLLDRIYCESIGWIFTPTYCNNRVLRQRHDDEPWFTGGKNNKTKRRKSMKNITRRRK